MSFEHKSVLLNETVNNLSIIPEGIYVDGTLGGGGHAYEVAKGLSDQGRIIGIDQDDAALAAAKHRLKEYEGKVTFIRSNFCDMQEELMKIGIAKVDGIILDLGVSSHQIDTIERGFSYKYDAPLDMRMDRRNSMTAKDIINEYSEQKLFQIIRDYGEDKFAKNIAKHIVAARRDKPIETTAELTEVIKAAIPMKIQKNLGHPSKKTFQAVRIELNQELEVLKNSLDNMISILKPGGRICVITFHSLEDRVVKLKFRSSEHTCTCPHDFPICICGNKPKGKCVNRKPILPSEEELLENRRAKSAKLRVFEKIKE